MHGQRVRCAKGVTLGYATRPPRPSLSLVRCPPVSPFGREGEQIPHGASDLSECGVLLQIAQEMELLDGVEELEQSFGDSLGSRRSFAAPDVTSQ